MAVPGRIVSTLLLRFRDLVTEPGQAIEFHRDLCLARGHSWWGWWNRSGETVPYKLFVGLKAQAVRNDGLTIYLFNSGTAEFFEATCGDIHFDIRPLSAVASPDPESTPAYYRDQKYLAWFSLTSIDK